MSTQDTARQRKHRLPLSLPRCREACTVAHTLDVAMILLGIGRTRLYQLMNGKQISYVQYEHGRRIRHNVIEAYLQNHTIE